MKLEFRSSLAGLEQPWDALRRRSHANHLFLSFAWQSLWWSIFGVGRDIHLVLLWDGEELAGLAPLYREGTTLRLIGGADLTDYLDLLYRPDAGPALIEALAGHLAEAGGLDLDLHCLPAASPTLGLWPALDGRHCLRVTVSEQDVCPAVDLSGGWDGYLAGLTKKDRHELRRKLRRLEAQGDVRREMLTDPAAIRAAWPDFFRLHRLSKREKTEFLTPEVRRFFEALGETFGPTGALRLCFLEVGGRRVSAVLCFAEGDALWLYNSGYDPEYRHLSVGLLLKVLCLRDAIDEGRRQFDFLRGREPYKYDLGGVDAAIYRLHVAREEAGE